MYNPSVILCSVAGLIVLWFTHHIPIQTAVRKENF